MMQQDNCKPRDASLRSKPFGLSDALADSISLQSLTLTAGSVQTRDSPRNLPKAREKRNNYLEKGGKVGKGKVEPSIGQKPSKQKGASENSLPSRPVEVPQRGASRMSNFRQSKDFLLLDAWERKREEKDNKPEFEASQNFKSKAGKKCRPDEHSLTDDDFEELKGCIDLGFSFGEEYDPDLCHTFPALKVCYAIKQAFNDSTAGSLSPTSIADSDVGASPTSPVSTWQICSPGDRPQQVKAKLRHWAQAVACTVRQSC